MWKDKGKSTASGGGGDTSLGNKGLVSDVRWQNMKQRYGGPIRMAGLSAGEDLFVDVLH